MPSHDVDENSGAALVGGELRDWSDLHHGDPSLVALVLERVLAAVAAAASAGSTGSGDAPDPATSVRGPHPRRVLLVGSWATRLLDLLSDVVDRSDVHVTVAARALDDVRAARARRPDPWISWVAGSVDRLPVAGDYDLVVALGGLDTMLGPDSQDWGAQHLVRHLAGCLAPGGSLVVDVRNRIGLDRLVTVPPNRRRSDAAFVADMAGRPAGGLHLHEVAGVASGADLEVIESYAAWPVFARPTALVTAGALEHREIVDLARWAARGGIRAGVEADLVTDPTPAVTDALASAATSAALAPGWVLVLGRGDGDGAAVGAALPLLVGAERTMSEPFRRLAVVDADQDGTVACAMRWLAPVGSSSVTAGPWSRSLASPEPGPRLDSAVRDALQVADRDTARRLLSRWARGLLDQDAADPLDLGWMPGNLSERPDGALALVDGSWSLAGPLPLPTELVAAGLLDLARHVVETGDEHPFGEAAGEDDVARELSVLAASGPYDANAARAVLELLRPTGLVGTPAPTEAGRGAAMPRQQLLARFRAAEDAIVEERAKARWLEGTLRARDRRIRVLERSIRVESSTAYALVSHAARPIPALRRRARQAAERLRRR